jgi:hypothetical protein
LLQNVLPGALGTFCKTLKWILIVLFGILVVLIVLAVSGIMALFK